LKVLLIERKKVISHIERQCAQFASIGFSVLGEPIKKYGYLEPISLEVGTDKTRVHFPGPGFSIDYNGPLRPYLLVKRSEGKSIYPVIPLSFQKVR
jgi:hypothetical protein